MGEVVEHIGDELAETLGERGRHIFRQQQLVEHVIETAVGQHLEREDDLYEIEIAEIAAQNAPEQRVESAAELAVEEGVFEQLVNADLELREDRVLHQIVQHEVDQQIEQPVEGVAVREALERVLQEGVVGRVLVAVEPIDHPAQNQFAEVAGTFRVAEAVVAAEFRAGQFADLQLHQLAHNRLEHVIEPLRVLDIEICDLVEQIFDEPHNVVHIEDRDVADFDAVADIRREEALQHAAQIEAELLLQIDDQAAVGRGDLREHIAEIVLDNAHQEGRGFGASVFGKAAAEAKVERAVFIGVVVIGHAIELHLFHGVKVHRFRFHERLAALEAGQFVFAVGVGEARHGVGLEVIQRVAVVVDHTGGVGDVQMAGEGVMNAHLRQRFRRVHVVVEHEGVGDRRLDLHMRREGVVDHQKRRAAVFFALIRPSGDPRHQIGVDHTGGLFLLRLVEGVLARVDHDQPVVVVKIRYIGKTALDLLLVRRVAVGRTLPALRGDGMVVAEVLVNVEELFVGDRLGRLLLVIFIRHSLQRVDVVVAVDDKNFHPGLFFKVLEDVRQHLMGDQFAVLRQIAGDHHILDARFFGARRHRLERRTDDRFRFVEHLAVQPAGVDPDLAAVALRTVGEDVRIAQRIERQRRADRLIARFRGGKQLNDAEQQHGAQRD